MVSWTLGDVIAINFKQHWRVFSKAMDCSKTGVLQLLQQDVAHAVQLIATPYERSSGSFESETPIVFSANRACPCHGARLGSPGQRTQFWGHPSAHHEQGKCTLDRSRAISEEAAELKELSVRATSKEGFMKAVSCSCDMVKLLSICAAQANQGST
jgi:hypothetical protein